MEDIRGTQPTELGKESSHGLTETQVASTELALVYWSAPGLLLMCYSCSHGVFTGYVMSLMFLPVLRTLTYIRLPCPAVM